MTRQQNPFQKRLNLPAQCRKEETSRRFYNTQHPCDCGIDLHARAMYVCILNQAGETLRHHHMKTTPEAFLNVMAPYRPDIVVAVECLCTWDLARRPRRR